MNQNRIENKSHLLSYAMHAGVFLGVFWTLNYLLVIFGQGNMLLTSLHSLFRLGTPLLLFYFLRNYNEKYLHNTMRFGHGFQFSILLFFFGSILEALIVFAHIMWLDPGFIAAHQQATLQAMQHFNFGSTFYAQFAAQPLPTPFMFLFRNVFSVNVFSGILLSLIIVPVVQRFKIVRNQP